MVSSCDPGVLRIALLASRLVAADGTQYPPGPVPPGSYSLRVFFPGDAHATPVRDATVGAGEVAVFQCEPTMRSCL